MKVKRFFAPDMRQAMQRVREEIGPDAVIVSNHRVAGGVEVVAAHEHEYEAAQEAFKRKQAQEKQQQQLQQQSAREASPKLQSNLADELRKAQARIAAAQAGTEEPAKAKNQQVDDTDLDGILDTLKQRQAQQAARNFERNEQRQPGSIVPPDPVTPPPAPGIDEYVAQSKPATRQEPSYTAPAPDPQVATMRAEIDTLKSLLIQQVSQPKEAVSAPERATVMPKPQPEASEESVLQRRVENRLEKLGIGPHLRRQLIKLDGTASLDDSWRDTLAKLSDSIPVIGGDFVERGGMIAFVGPTGVGKTTTIGKLAARYVLKHGSSSVALVTTDSYRIAAHEQLLTFGRILDIPVRVVDENHSLDEVLLSLRNKRLVLIDTAGMSAHEPHTQAQLDMLQSVSVRMKKLLVLSCSSQRHVIENAYETYSRMGLNGCILSKLDESGNLGEAIELIVDNGLPVTYVTDGQRVPDDLEVAHKRDLVSRAVVTAQRVSRNQRMAQDRRQDKLSQNGQWVD
ncbi:flagellar biosynthesis protein FlhF [Aliamphritea ceti]|uniref:flagellar biosynthesis protein FlhF n=1 Tax=Aliamphritea ceti TaxID=1524258 RepID=UPI0021C3CF14|nr:flagellar biosynthesis protein FlhF [Aliamphritea ceti]